MNRRTFLKSCTLAAAGLAVRPCTTKAAPVARELPVLRLTGTPRKRGRIHGEALREKIREHLELWKADNGAWTKLDPDAYLTEFIEKNRFVPAIKKWTPDLFEEVEGLAEASGVDLKTMLAFQFMDENWLFGMHKMHKLPIPGSGCSVLGVYGQAGVPTLLAQNMDLGAFSDGYQVLFRIKEGDLETLVPSYVGIIGLNGMNNRGIGVVLNALVEIGHCLDGLPVAFVHRGVLKRRTLQEAVKFLHQIKHASGQAYTIGSPEKIVSFECSSNKVVPFSPEGVENRVWRTNHPLVNDDLELYKKLVSKMPAGDQKKEAQFLKSSKTRYNAIGRRLRDAKKTIRIQEVREALSSRDDPKFPVCRTKPKNPSSSMTLHCSIMELSKNPVLHLAPGPPCQTRFQSYRFS